MSQRPRPVTRAIPTIAATILLVLISGALVTKPRAFAQTDATPTPLPLYALPDGRTNRPTTSSTIALAGDGRTIVAANMINNTATIVIPTYNQVVAEIPVGRDPRSAAITPDESRALVTNRTDGTLSVIDMLGRSVTATIPLGVGTLPYGVVAQNNAAYVSLLGSDQIALVDLVENRLGGLIDVSDAPAGLALWGDFLYVTHLWSGELSLIYLPTRRVIETRRTGVDTALFQSIELDITRGLAYFPQTRLNAQNPALTYDTIAFPVVNVMDLRALSMLGGDRVALDTADRPVNLPFAIALDRFARRLYVANAGSDDVSVIDLATSEARAHIAVGANPRGILLNRDNTLLYVHNALDGTLSMISTADFSVLDVMPIVNLNTPLEQVLGAQLFHSAVDPRMSADPVISCATCHFDGLSDGRVWVGYPDGPRNTPLLFGLPETVPYNWSATWDELADVELKIRHLQAGTGLIEDDALVSPALGNPHTGISVDLDLLTRYLASLTAPPTPLAVDAEVMERGSAIFAARECSACHVGGVGTDLQTHDVGTGGSPLERMGTAFDTPSLRWLWLSAPYFHDGLALTLREVFELPGDHQLLYDLPPEDIDALVYYLLRLPQSS